MLHHRVRCAHGHCLRAAMTYAEAMTAHAAQYLRDCLTQAHGRVTTAAIAAGVDRRYFYQLCARCGVQCGRAKQWSSQRASIRAFAAWRR